MSTTVEPILEEIRGRRTRAAEAFDGLVASLVAGESVDSGKACKILDAAGESVTGLEQRVRRGQRIRQLQAVVESRPALMAELTSLQAERSRQIEVEKREAVELQQKLRTSASDFEAKLSPLRQRQREIDEARRELAQLTAPPRDPPPADQPPFGLLHNEGAPLGMWASPVSPPEPRSPSPDFPPPANKENTP